jgi:hypothetical protein
MQINSYIKTIKFISKINNNILNKHIKSLMPQLA